MITEKNIFRLSQVRFPAKPGEPTKNRIALLGRLRHVHYDFNSEPKVRMSIGKRLVNFGNASSLENAARFADMAVLYFWKHRKRSQDSPKDSDFNFSYREAANDLNDFPEVVGILKLYEQSLISNGGIAPVSESDYYKRVSEIVSELKTISLRLGKPVNELINEPRQ